MTSAQSVVPYDENLLERARTQWQFGDWQSLANLDRDTLQHHPERAKLALLAAAGCMQTDKDAEARNFIRLAQGWGIGKKLISQILIAGVHNSIARAAAIFGHKDRAIRHFENAVALGAPGTDVKLFLKARISEQAMQLGGDVNWGSLLQDMESFSRKSFDTPSGSLRRNGLTVIADQRAEFESIKSALERTISRKVENATRQLEAFLEIQNYLNDGELTGEMHGWPISPDFALKLIDVLESNQYDLVVEFGSGTSTVLIAKVLARKTKRGEGRRAVRQVAFEHLKEFHEKTSVALRNAGLEAKVDLVFSPLEPYDSSRAASSSYYSCAQKLAEIASDIAERQPKIFVLVDGPPQSTGKHARYPALPVLLKAFPGAALDVLLDDYARSDEEEVASIWCKEANELGYFVDFTQYCFEKGAALLRIVKGAPDRSNLVCSNNNSVREQ